MNTLDWLVLVGTVVSIVAYGAWRTRHQQSLETFIKGNNSMKWWMIGISIMATQASAITFLSTPGQAMEDGMRFLQFYFGLPIAMIIISVTIVPIYYRLKVYTAYEYLETRFDLKTRVLTAGLFLILRGLSAGITLFAPSLVLSTVLGWPLELTTVLIGVLVIVYTVSGGNSAVSLTQRQQLAVVMGGMVLAGVLAFVKLPEGLSFTDTVSMAGALGKFNMINVLPAGLADAENLTLWQKINAVLTDRFNIWSGLIASVFLFLSYFGTDQSQVARYLGGKSLTESRLGLVFNGLLKIPMQFVILFIGVVVSVFYLFNQPPVFYNTVLKEQAQKGGRAQEIARFEKTYDSIYAHKQRAAGALAQAVQNEDAGGRQQAAREIKILQVQENQIRQAVKQEIEKAVPGAKTQDRDYMFLYFVLNYLPHGVVGLLLAVMFLAAMSSMAGELSALSSTTSVDVYKRLLNANASAQHYLSAGRWFTVAWALLAMVFAMLAGFAENLIQFVNIVGSLFYGTILGIFLTAFYLKRVRGTAVFVAALVAEATVLYCYFYTDLAFLLYNIIGCGVVMVVALSLSIVARGR